MQVNFLPHCNRQALVQISCPTQRKIFSAVSQLLSPVMLFYFSLSLIGWIYWRKRGKGGAEKGEGGEGRTEEFSARLCRILIHDFASIHGGCSGTFPRASLLFSNFM